MAEFHITAMQLVLGVWAILVGMLVELDGRRNPFASVMPMAMMGMMFTAFGVVLIFVALTRHYSIPHFIGTLLLGAVVEYITRCEGSKPELEGTKRAWMLGALNNLGVGIMIGSLLGLSAHLTAVQFWSTVVLLVGATFVAYSRRFWPFHKRKTGETAE